MQSKLSYEAEEYIEAIYRLQNRNGAAKTKKLAKELGVVPGSITNTVEHLEKHGLVTHEPYRGVKLTKAGERLALGILRRHRLAERLLTDILGVELNSVHENACKLEHALSREVTDLIDERLGKPQSCPHGNPIPTADGELKEEEFYPLTEIRLNEHCVVAKITDERREKLLSLAKKGIKPNVSINVIGQSPSQTVLSVAGKKRILHRDLAASVWVRKIGREKHAQRKKKV